MLVTRKSRARFLPAAEWAGRAIVYLQWVGKIRAGIQLQRYGCSPRT